MAIEIERKFLVISDDWRINEPVAIRQGYLNRDPDRTVRVRTAGSQAWITIKGRTVGAVRSEFEYPIPLNDADALLILCERPLLEKRRYHFEHDGRVWEIRGWTIRDAIERVLAPRDFDDTRFACHLTEPDVVLIAV